MRLESTPLSTSPGQAPGLAQGVTQEVAPGLADPSGLHLLELPTRPHHLAVDTALLYSARHRAGACRLRVFVPPVGEITEQHPAVALVTEQPEHEGLSVTNGIESIAQILCRESGLPPQRIILIEHYDDRDRGLAARLPGRIDGEKFSNVVFEDMCAVESEPGAFQLLYPQWQCLGKAEVEALIGQLLP